MFWRRWHKTSDTFHRNGSNKLYALIVGAEAKVDFRRGQDIGWRLLIILKSVTQMR